MKIEDIFHLEPI